MVGPLHDRIEALGGGKGIFMNGAQGGMVTSCTVEPSCDPAVLLAAESGVGMAAARADAQLQQAVDDTTAARHALTARVQAAKEDEP